MKLRSLLLSFLILCSIFVSAQQKPASKSALHPTANKSGIKVTTSAHTAALTCNPPSPLGGITGYYFYRGTVSGQESSTPLNSTPANTCGYTDVGLAALTTYFYTAKSYCPTCSPTISTTASNEASGTTTADPAPPPPTGLAVQTIANNSIPLIWKNPAQDNGYIQIASEIYRGSASSLPSPALIGIVPANVLQFSDSTCKLKTCYYEIKSYVIAGNKSFVISAPSNIVGATP